MMIGITLLNDLATTLGDSKMLPRKAIHSALNDLIPSTVHIIPRVKMEPPTTNINQILI